MQDKTKEQDNIDTITGVKKPEGLKELGESYILEEAAEVRDSNGDLVELPRGTRIRI